MVHPSPSASPRPVVVIMSYGFPLGLVITVVALLLVAAAIVGTVLLALRSVRRRSM